MNSKRKDNTHITQSDHNVMITKFSMSWNKDETKAEEVFNLKDEEDQKRFKYETYNTIKLLEVFDNDDDLEKQTKKFLKHLQRCIHMCF